MSLVTNLRLELTAGMFLSKEHFIHELQCQCSQAADRIEALEKALKAVQERADNNTLGTSKVQDMRQIATQALEDQ